MTTFSGAGADAKMPGAPVDTYIAALRMLPGNPGDPGGSADAAWLRACYRLTPRVERISPSRALLDLGRCTPAEALEATRLLLTWLGDRAASARVGAWRRASRSRSWPCSRPRRPALSGW